MKKTYAYPCAPQNILHSINTIIFTIFLLTLMLSCKKQQAPVNDSMQQATVSASAVEATVTKEQALARLNEHFANEFSTITMEQVNGVNRKQFTQWLRNSKMAAAEDLYLNPLLSSNSNEYVILKNVTVKETGKLASVGLIATTAPFYPQYTRMVAVINYTNIFVGNKKICSWKRCDSYSACPCILWIDFVTGDCPSDKCVNSYDCRGFSSGDCDGELTGITTYEVLQTF
jgi:hypothetical protein